MHNILWLTFPCTRGRFLVSLCQEKKKKKSRGGFLKNSYMKHPWFHDSHQSQNTPSPYLHSAPDSDKLCPPTSFLFLSLKLLNSKKMNQSCSAKTIQPNIKKKKLFTKTNKNQYIKTIFLARQKAYKKK